MTEAESYNVPGTGTIRNCIRYWYMWYSMYNTIPWYNDLNHVPVLRVTILIITVLYADCTMAWNTVNVLGH